MTTTQRCAECGEAITLVGISKTRFRWMTDPDSASSWHCGDDPRFPVKSHNPPELVKP